jgi:hypothetical protein
MLLVFAADANLLGCNLYTIKGNTETLIDTSKEVGLEVNWERTMLMSHHQNVGYICNVKIANRSIENMRQFKSLRMTIIVQNSVYEEIKRRLNSCNACYHWVHYLPSSYPLSKEVMIKIYKTIIFIWFCMDI